MRWLSPILVLVLASAPTVTAQQAPPSRPDPAPPGLPAPFPAPPPAAASGTARFAFTDLPAGRYFLQASLGGYVRADAGTLDVGTSFEVAEAEVRDDVSLPL